MIDALPTRRDVLCCVGCLFLGLWRPWATESSTDADDGSDEPPRTPEEIALFAARWQLHAMQDGWPDHWHLFHLTGAVQYSPALTVAYGIGPWRETAVDLPLAIEMAHDLGRRVPSAHMTPCGCSWAITVEGACDDRLRHVMRGLTPSWWRCFDPDNHDPEALAKVLAHAKR